jgi:DNA helicase II / ATP-dependent DNA helicase PcrA
MDASNLLDHLNPNQRQAAELTEGPVLILAGAGSGKTRVLTYRMAHIILNGLATPDEILAVTFTNKASKEMEARVVKLLKDLGVPVFSQPWVSTFHSMCVRILRQNLMLLGYQPGFSIYDSDDQLKMIKEVMKRLNINDKIYPPKNFASKINQAKTQMLMPGDIGKRSDAFFDDKSLEVYENYETAMKQSNALDFSDLLLKTYQVFKEFPHVLKGYQDKFKYIHVDEYQDTNKIQYNLIRLLAAAHGNLCVVGDEDQSIYSWRGADINNILDFEKDFDGQVIKLEKNYRSSGNIVNAANGVISNNVFRKSKTLYTDNPDGDKITVAEMTNEYDESRFVANHTEKFLNSGYSPKDFAIFYRTNAQSRVLEEQLRLKNIPYKIVGGMKFYERKEIKDVIGYLKVILNPNDDMAMKRIINVPTRGLGKTTIEKIENIAVQDGVNFLQAIRTTVDNKVVTAGTLKKLDGFYKLIQRLINKKDMPLNDLYLSVLDETAYIQSLQIENSLESKSRIENLEELNNAIVQFSKERQGEATLQSFLEEMSLVSDIDQVDDTWNSVTLMTLHISKGLEFPIVFMVGMEEGLFPGHQKINEADETEMEEERRLCYVGMTRAREKLFMLHSRTRKVWGQDQFHPPSRFLAELPEDFVQKSQTAARPKFLDSFASRPPSSFGSSNGSSSSSYSRTPSKSSAPNKFVTRKKPEVSNDPFPDYENVVSDLGGSGSLRKGSKVKHPTFGVGSIYEIEGSGDTEKVSVLFRDNTIRKFITKYARLELV